MRELEIIRLGRIGYRAGLELMEQRLEARTKGLVPDAIFLLEHDPVLTLGRRANLQNILASPERLQSLGIEVVETGRGGDVTYHGPGQIVGYPVIDLAPDRKDVRRYVCDLEKVMMRVSESYGLKAGRVEGHIGCWIEGQRKIGAIGVRISRWCTSHGFAFNVTSNLDAFSLIVPCGIRDKGVTSLAAELGQEVSLPTVMDQLEAELRATFAADRPDRC